MGSKLVEGGLFAGGTLGSVSTIVGLQHLLFYFPITKDPGLAEKVLQLGAVETVAGLIVALICFSTLNARTGARS